MVHEGSYAITVPIIDTSKTDSTTGTISVAKEDTTLEYSGETLSAPAAQATTSTPSGEVGSREPRRRLTAISASRARYDIDQVHPLASSPDGTFDSLVASCRTMHRALITFGSAGIGVGERRWLQNLSADNYTVKIELVANGYYTAPSENSGRDRRANRVPASRPAADGSTSRLCRAESNFGFTVKYLKNGNIQGNSLYIYRKTLAANQSRTLRVGFLPAGKYNWIIKSNAMSGLTQTCTTTTPKVCTATSRARTTSPPSTGRPAWRTASAATTNSRST